MFNLSKSKNKRPIEDNKWKNNGTPRKSRSLTIKYLIST